MDYSYISGAQSQPLSLYGLHGLPTPDSNQTPHAAADDLQDAFSAAGLVRAAFIFVQEDRTNWEVIELPRSWQ